MATTGSEAAGRGPTVVVTGAGSSLGVSIFKALRQSRLRPRIVATDAEPLSVGLFRADAAHIVPWASRTEEYLERLVKVCRDEGAAMVCFGSDIELEVAAPRLAELERATGAAFIVNRVDTLTTFLDKWDTIVALRDRGLPAPETVLADDREAMDAFLARHRFPLMVKARRGAGSKDVVTVRTPRELQLVSELLSSAVVQEYLAPASEEYTVGAYRSRRQGYLGQIIFRRVLAAGLTYKAEVVDDDTIAMLTRSVLETFDFFGPVNLQLRRTEAGPRIFEINPRFSSSSVMRAHFGFNEAELCLRDVVLGEDVSPPVVRPGHALRYWDEIYLEPTTTATLIDDPTNLTVLREDDF